MLGEWWRGEREEKRGGERRQGEGSKRKIQSTEKPRGGKKRAENLVVSAQGKGAIRGKAGGAWRLGLTCFGDKMGLEVGTGDIGSGHWCSPGPERTQPGLRGTLVQEEARVKDIHVLA